MNNPYDLSNGNPCFGNNTQCNCASQVAQIKQCLCCINKQLSTLIASGGVDLTEVISMLTDIQSSITDLSSSITTVAEGVETISTEQTEYYNGTIDAINALSNQSTEQYNNIMEAIKKCCKCKDEDDKEDKDDK